MKRNFISIRTFITVPSITKFLSLLLIVLFCFSKTKAQYTATWALTSNKTVVVTGASATGVAALNMEPGTIFPNPGSHNTDGYQCIQTIGDWPTIATDGYHIDFPFSPNVNVDVNLTGLTLTARTSGSSGNNLISLAYQKNGTGPWVAFGTPQTAPSGGSNNLNFGTLTQKFYATNTYVIRMYIYAAGTVSSSRNVRIRNVVLTGTIVSPAGTQPTVTSNTATATGRYTATATGTVTAGTLAVTTSGICYGTAPTPTIANNITTNGPTGSGTINSTLTGLNAGTLYYTRAYVTSESGNTFYGTQLSFTTDAPVIPILTTTAVSNILSNKATSGGVITDSGGVTINTKGVCWNTTGTPTIANSKTIDGSGNASYASVLNGLTPSTTYFVRAYATNAIGTGYGNERSFTTAPPIAVIAATPTALSFGGVIPNSTSANLTYTLSAAILSPAAGNITVTAPAGFQVSLSPGSGFSSTLNVPYTGSTLAATTIYVHFTPTQFGAYTGIITHSGGSAIAINIDNVTVSGTGIPNPSDLSNMGTDFWVGYGFQSLMTGNNSQDMILYISSKQDATVTVDIPGIGYTQTYAVTANVALATNPIPKAGLQDARLNSTGILNRGIHVYSNGIPIAVWGHIYASQSSGATMVLPTNTWGTDYTVLTTGGQTNSGVPHSFFFVQANENNTIIDITPSADITATANGTTTLYPAGVPFPITLNQGEVFNALGKLNSSSNGVDLTGTKVKARDCKKIALFTGNGRVQLTVGGCSPGNGGSDNFIQQMFPKATWGSKYLTVPFRDMEAGFYRVVVSDPATVVKLNGVVVPSANLVNNFYYQIETDTTNLIESDKPVMVAQYCATNTCSGTGLTDHPSTGTTGDPEMIILSPTAQAINDVTVFSAIQYSIQHNYINVVIKNSGVASFLLDGVNVSAQFKIHQKDPNYSYAVFADLAGGVSHRLTSVEAFNAIAYGFSSSSSNESYGYNAGTSLKDLSTSMLINNPFGVSGNATTCKNNPIKFRVAIPVAPANINSLTWSFNTNPNLTPNTTVTQNAPLTSDSTFLVDGASLYAYSLGTYTFSAAGIYPIKVTGNLLTADGCTGLKEYNFNIIVTEGVKPDFTGNLNVCLGDTVRLFDASNGQGTTVTGWRWDWVDGSPIETTQNVKHRYATAGTYNVKLRAINNIGCYADTVKAIGVFAPPTANFRILDTACVSQVIRFDNLSTIAVGTIVKWTWNFGDGTPIVVATTNAQQTHTYATPGIYTVTLIVESNIGCQSIAVTKLVPVYKTTADFSFLPNPTCINTPTQFTDASTGGGATVNTWVWNFGNATTSNLQNPLPVTYATATTFNVSLVATSNKGCVGTVTKQVTVASLLTAPVATVTDSSFNSVTFTWTAIVGAAGYQVSVNGGSFITPSSGTTGLTHVVTGLTPNQTVCIVVRVVGTVTCQTNAGVSVCGKSLLPSLEIYLPNTFTPNGDGKNDIFKVYGNYITKVKMTIFNQWGEKVFETTDVNAGWDGTAKGKLQPVGVYMYVISASTLDGKNYNKRGSINLIR